MTAHPHLAASHAVSAALEFASQPSPGYLFKLGDKVCSVDLLTRGEVDHRCVQAGRRLYRITYSLWPNEPERQIWLSEDVLLGEPEGSHYWMLWNANRDAARVFVEAVLARRDR